MKGIMSVLKKRTIKGRDYVMVVLKTLEKDEFGRPTKVVVGYDDTVFNLEGGEEFYIGFVSATALEGALHPKVKA